MTPVELLDAAKSRFVVLYHRDPTVLGSLLKQALGKFQDKAGVIMKTRLGEGITMPLPDQFLDVAVAHDARNCFVPTSVEGEAIEFEVNAATVYPVTLHYFLNLREWPEDKNLPSGCTSLLLDYLVATIDLPNTERQRGALLASGQQATDLPSPSELRERILTLEAMMEDNQSILPPVAVM